MVKMRRCTKFHRDSVNCCWVVRFNGFWATVYKTVRPVL